MYLLRIQKRGLTNSWYGRALKSWLEAFVSAVAKLVAVNQTLSGSLPSSEGLLSCESALQTGVKESALAIVDLSWVAYSLSCQQVNPVIAAVLYKSACGDELTNMRGALISVVAACCFTMVSIIIFVGSGLANTLEPSQIRCCPRRYDKKFVHGQSSSEAIWSPSKSELKAEQSSTGESERNGNAVFVDDGSKKEISKHSAAVQLA